MKTTLWAMALFSAISVKAQDPVHWSYEAQKLKDKIYEIHITATMDEGWHIYSQTQPKEAIAQPTNIVFTKNPLLVFSGKVQEIGKKEMYEDKVTEIKQYQYGGKVDFVQVITLKAAVKTNITGSLTWQVCTDERCLPPKTITFNVPVSN
jgi:Disulphide bond corrector protein DsbC